MMVIFDIYYRFRVELAYYNSCAQAVHIIINNIQVICQVMYVHHILCYTHDILCELASLIRLSQLHLQLVVVDI